jgi:hypothetical protein
MNKQVIFDDLANGRPDFIDYGVAIIGKQYKLETYVNQSPKLFKRVLFWWIDTRITGLQSLVDGLISLGGWIEIALKG